MKNLRMILMSIMTMFMIIGNVNSQEEGVEYGFSMNYIEDYNMELSNFKQNPNENKEFKIQNYYDNSGDPYLNTTSYVGVTIPKGSIGMYDEKTYKIKIKLYLDILIKDINHGTYYKVIVNDDNEFNIDFDPVYDNNGDLTNLGQFKGHFEITEEFEVTGDVNIKIFSDEFTYNDKVEFKGGKDNFIITNMGEVQTSSVSENDISNDFNVYTHNNNLIVKTDDYNTQYEVSVHNMNGQMVMSEKNNGQMETYLQVPNGIYIVNLSTDKGVVRKKIAVQ